jgi:uridine kinase
MLATMALLDTVAGRINGLQAHQPRVLLGIDGPDAAGKTTLADDLATLLGASAIRASIDDFEHPAEHRIRHGRGGDTYYRNGFDHQTFRAVLLEPFAAGAHLVVTKWRDPHTGVPHEVTVEVPARAILVADGVFLQRPELRELWSYVVYLKVDPAVSLERARTRDLGWTGSVEEIELGYRVRYLPGQQIYRDAVDPETLADLLVDNTDPSAPVVLRHSDRL